MNATICCLGLGMIVLFFATMIFIRENNKKIAKLKKELEKTMGCIDYLRQYVRLMNKDLEQTDKTLNDLKEKLENSEKSLDVASHLKGIEGSLKGMLDIAEQEHTEAAERKIKAFCEYSDASEETSDDDEPYADIPGDLDDSFEGEEPATDEQREALEYTEKMIKNKNDIPSYRWVFPHNDYGENWPVLGEEYLVVGRERKTGEVISGIGTWAGTKYDMDEGYKLDKVYAYIRLPSPSDVMNEVLDIKLKE